MIRYIDRRRERDNHHVRKNQHTGAAAKNVSAGFGFRFQRFINPRIISIRQLLGEVLTLASWPGRATELTMIFSLAR
jgi:hypothetical protein